MNIFKSIAIAFSLYSKIPMPVFDWKEKEMKYNLIFFPWIGLIIGGLEMMCYITFSRIVIPELAATCLFLLIPIIITGGFHLDGYMDVSDALSSYADKEKKLEILKDPHIGAFAVIRLVCAILIYGAGLSVLIDKCHTESFVVFCFSFYISRCVSGLSAHLLPKAKKEGMLYEETKNSNKAIIIPIVLQLIIGIAIMFLLSIVHSVFMLIGAAISFIWYLHMTKKNFGGVTGDTAGYLVVNMEMVMLIMLDISLYL